MEFAVETGKRVQCRAYFLCFSFSLQAACGELSRVARKVAGQGPRAAQAALGARAGGR